MEVSLPEPLSLAAEVGAMQQQCDASSTASTCVLKLKGLPYTATEADLLSFFEGFQVVKASVHIGHDGRPSGLVRCLGRAHAS